ncbi:MAG: hypothetical protein J6T52_02980 [Bacteroidaceae bacterium]|nr:hypothetical protein [Bacteroidaceae bacterium]
MSDKCQEKGFSMTAELNNFAKTKVMKNGFGETEAHKKTNEDEQEKNH